MAVETADDRAIFLSADDFGTTVLYQDYLGNVSNVVGIFDNDFIEVDAGGGVGYALQQPRFVCRTADMPNAKENEILTINGLDDIIRVVQPDGTGMTTVVVEVPR